MGITETPLFLWSAQTQQGLEEDMPGSKHQLGSMPDILMPEGHRDSSCSSWERFSLREQGLGLRHRGFSKCWMFIRITFG